ncbi:glycosyl hydrolase family 28-related protein [Vulgatibacter incomptus]|uniref:Calcium-binding outer membrane-like protein n=1 Tax=Vulgatibacter incomptus TaxID=1391653 RepID=A0A0K1PD52_9BACT|nr:glycosyl hydrolase family 28-related protein [Vulgatibacter incomptus]AKU91473.1 calcium-binding outer membrane-like protein [Vulgatibacter incomptus]
MVASRIGNPEIRATSVIRVRAGPDDSPIVLEPPSATVDAGGRRQFHAVVLGSDDQAVIWRVDEGARGGAVDPTGLYTAPSAPGVFTLVATSVIDPDLSASASITVREREPVVVTVEPATIDLLAAERLRFQAIVSGADDTTVSWTTSAGTIDATGLYTAPSEPGTYSVIATSLADPQASATAQVTVRAQEPVVVTIDPAEIGLLSSESHRFQARVSGINDHSVNWSASGGTIDSTGLYTAPTELGLYTVVATSLVDPQATGTAQVTVRAREPVVVSIDPTYVELLTSESQRFQAWVSGTDDHSVSWSASGGTIDSTGLYTAPSEQGTYSVVATSLADPQSSATAQVVVRAREPVVVTIEPAEIELLTSESHLFQARVSGTDDHGVSWSASRGTIDSGLYTAPPEPGTYTLVATSLANPQSSATAQVTVKAREPVVVTIEPSDIELLTSESHLFQARVSGTVDQIVSWTASGGTIDSTGLYTASTEPGVYTVIATSLADPQSSATAQVTVKAREPVVVTIEPTEIELLTSESHRFQARVSGTEDHTVSWSASGGTIVATGLYTAPSEPGTYSVVATSFADPQATATAQVVVRAREPVVVSIDPIYVELLTSESQRFQAWVSGTDDHTVSWSASGGTIDAGGLYTSPSEPGTYSVVATSLADPQSGATAQVVVRAREPVVVTIEPAEIELLTSESHLFQASVSGTTDQAVTWSATAGAIDSTGLYTAPSQPGTYAVMVTSLADRRATATAQVVVRAREPVVVTIEPTEIELLTSESRRFQASVSGTNDHTVSWSASGGTIDPTGLFTAPSHQGTFVVVATSLAEPQSSATAQVRVTAREPVIVTIEPAEIELLTSESRRFQASVSGTTDQAVTWSAPAGVIDATGLYTAPSDPGTYAVIATSLADPQASATARIMVKAREPVVVSIDPIFVELLTSESQRFQAWVSGTTDQAVTWFASAGAIDATGLFAAPSQPGTYSVVATSLADPQATAIAQVVVKAREPIVVSIDPIFVELLTSESQRFQAWVSGTTDQAVTWFASAGAIDATGLFAAPSQPGTYAVVATSLADPRASATARITVRAREPVVVTIEPTEIELLTSESHLFESRVSGTNDGRVSWFASHGTVDDGGLYTAPPEPGTYAVTATSLADPRASATAQVVVRAREPVVVTIEPAEIELLTSESHRFQASVSGTTDQAVTWSASAGFIDTTGLFTAPSQPGTFVVVATSLAEPQSSATARVRVMAREPVVVTIEPAEIELLTSESRRFQASVSGTTDQAVTWSAPAGVIDATGLYTAPSDPGIYAVIATSLADPQASATARITVKAREPVIVSIDPIYVELLTSESQRFQAWVSGTDDRTVSWSASGGTIDGGGLYIAPSDSGTYSVVATSLADPQATATAQVVVKAREPVVVSIDPTYVELLTSESQRFQAWVSGTTDQAVTWFASAGAIDATGLFAAPSQPGTYAVVATSLADPQSSATAQVVVRAREPVVVTIEPAEIELLTSESHRFQTRVSGTVDQTVRWSTSIGTIDSSGLYTAPSEPGMYVVVATSLADPQSSATAQVVVRAREPIVVSIDPIYVELLTFESQRFLVWLSGTADQSVSWSASGGTINAGGQFNAPSEPGTYSVIATSLADPQSSATAQVVVRAREPVVVAIEPAEIELLTSESHRFQARVTGTDDHGVSWFASGGTIDFTGLYTAPTGPGVYTVIATSLADPQSSATVQVVVRAREPVVVTIDPAEIELLTSESHRFQARVSGTNDRTVSWSTSGGTIDEGGLFVAPSEPGIYAVIATSLADPHSTATARITVWEREPVIVSIVPVEIQVLISESFRFQASVSGTTDQAVTWSASAGVIDATGLFTAPSRPGIYAVVATSLADPRGSATARVTVRPREPAVVTIAPGDIELLTLESHQFYAMVSGASDSAVTWSASRGTIDAGGRYTAPIVPGLYTVVATSVADPGAVAIALVTVVEPPVEGLLPADRITLWEPGLMAVGGIPSDHDARRPATIYLPAGNPYAGFSVNPALADGTTDAAAAIQAALNAAGNQARETSRRVVYLAAGTYFISGEGLNVPSFVTLRGRGARGDTVTRLVKAEGSQMSVINLGHLWVKNTTPVDVTADVPRGATRVTLARNPGYRVGELVFIDQLVDSERVGSWWNPINQPEPDGPERSWYSRQNRPTGQVLEIAAIDGNTLTFGTPVRLPYFTSNQAQVVRFAGGDQGGPMVPTKKWSGVEDLYVAGGEQGNVAFYATSYSWAKNVESDRSNGSSIAFESTFRCEARDSFFHSTANPNPGGGGYGIDLRIYASDNLVENNISWNFNKVITMRAAGPGNVVAYNYFEDGWGAGYPMIPEVGLNASHYSTTHYTLFEGNQAFNISGDAYWGNSIFNLYFRNHATGRRRSLPPLELSDEITRRFVEVPEWHLACSYVGNVLGSSDMSAEPQSGFVYEGRPPWYWDPVPIWAIGVEHNAGLEGQDAAVVATTLRHGNFDYVTRGIVWDPGIGDHRLPASLYLVSKPAFFGDHPWPWVTPEDAANRTRVLPARERFDSLLSSSN